MNSQYTLYVLETANEIMAFEKNLMKLWIHALQNRAVQLTSKEIHERTMAKIQRFDEHDYIEP